jgi:hypothetical protein
MQSWTHLTELADPKTITCFIAIVHLYTHVDLTDPKKKGMGSSSTPPAAAIIPSPAQGSIGGAICPLNIPMGRGNNQGVRNGLLNGGGIQSSSCR